MDDESLEFQRKSMRKRLWHVLAKTGLGLVWLGIIAAIIIEFSYDLSQQPTLRQVTVGLDTLIMSGLLIKNLVPLVQGNQKWLERINASRGPLIYASMCFGFYLWTPRIAGAFAIGAFLLTAIESISKSVFGDSLLSRLQLKPSQTLALGFGLVVFVGTGLLMLPAATVDGQGTPFFDAFFTMSSATSQTGLIVQDTGSYFSFFGQMIILIGMQIGGIGIMILSAAFAVLVGGKIPSRQARGLGDLGATEGMTAQSLDDEKGLQWLFGAIAKTTLWFEGFGVIIFYFMWLGGILELPDKFDNPSGALWWSIFHAVSGFCQGGFTLTADSLSRWVTNPAVNLVFIILITAGGLGFYVTGDLGRSNWRDIRSPRALWRRLQLHTQIVLATSLVMNVVGTLIYLFFEFDHSLKGLQPGGKILASIFQAVTLRCAGFNTVPIESLAAPTILFALAWMFIGSGPGSTGGGVRVTTACVSVASLRAMVFGRKEVEIFGRTIPQGTVYKALSVIFISALLVSGALILLTANENQPFEVLAFEVVSAFGTVGLSMGATASLSSIGKVLISLMMYFGRVGPLTVALAFAEKIDARRYRFAEEPMDVG